MSVTLKKRDWSALRALALDDPYVFARQVCGWKDLTDSTHRPLMYAMCGETRKLIDILDNPNEQSYAVRQLRFVLEVEKQCQWWTPEGRDRLDQYLNYVDIRMFRGGFKSSAFTHAKRVWMMTKDPNISAALISATEGRVTDRTKQIRRTIQSPIYRMLFPDRVPDDENANLTESQITLKGRTSPDQEPCLFAAAYRKGLGAYHFDEFDIDDLVVKENATPTELRGVHDFLGNLSGSYNPGIKYLIRIGVAGTRYADDDDHGSYFSKNKNYLNLVIPIEEYDEAPVDITVRGKPTVPELRDEEAITALQNDVLANPDMGHYWWRANYLLDPSAGGQRVFPVEVIRRSYWMFHTVTETDEKTVAAPKRDAKREIMKDGAGSPILMVRRPKLLYRAVACDQAVSQAASADDWCVAAAGLDTESIVWVLDAIRGKGYESMLDALLEMDTRWSPAQIGIEGGAQQEITHHWLREVPRFSRLRGRMVPIRHGNQRKTFRILNNVADPMKSYRLYIPPGERYLFIQDQMKRYDTTRTNADDNVLDAIAMAVSLCKRPINSESLAQDIRNMNAAYEKRIHPTTGIYIPT